MPFRNAFILAALIGLTGCASSTISSAVQSSNQKLELEGSPFRYVARDESSMVMTLLPLPVSPTKAVAPLAQQAMDAIEKSEARQGRVTTSLEEVRQLQDGREVWVLRTLSGTGIAYVVAFAAPSQQGSNIRMTGPHTYQK